MSSVHRTITSDSDYVVSFVELRMQIDTYCTPSVQILETHSDMRDAQRALRIPIRGIRSIFADFFAPLLNKVIVSALHSALHFDLVKTPMIATSEIPQPPRAAFFFLPAPLWCKRVSR